MALWSLWRSGQITQEGTGFADAGEFSWSHCDVATHTGVSLVRRHTRMTWYLISIPLIIWAETSSMQRSAYDFSHRINQS